MNLLEVSLFDFTDHKSHAARSIRRSQPEKYKESKAWADEVQAIIDAANSSIRCGRRPPPY
jgi:hypothetical protein